MCLFSIPGVISSFLLEFWPHIAVNELIMVDVDRGASSILFMPAGGAFSTSMIDSIRNGSSGLERSRVFRHSPKTCLLMSLNSGGSIRTEGWQSGAFYSSRSKSAGG